MNQKGFSLIELIATIVILGIIASITIFVVSSSFTKTKEKTEDVFIKTLEDALNIYIDSKDAKKLTFNTEVCTVNKRFNSSKIYQSNSLTFGYVIDPANNEYTPLVAEEFVNPANKDKTGAKECNLNSTVYIYRDEEEIYYYLVKKSDLECLNTTGYITNLPCDCLTGLVPEIYLPERCGIR